MSESAVQSALMVWVEARERRHEAAEQLAALNVRSEYKRSDDAPEVVAFQAAERAVNIAADELYEATRATLSMAVGDSWIIVSCIVGEPDGPREVDGRSEWSTIGQAEAALERYCDLHGLDPDDFTTIRKR